MNPMGVAGSEGTGSRHPLGPARGAVAAIAHTCFGFEAEFTAELRCIPMAVRRKLDLAGVKLKLVHWNGLTAAERQLLLAWPDRPAAVAELRLWLLARTAQQAAGVAGTLPIASQESWQQQQETPPLVSTAFVGTAGTSVRWPPCTTMQPLGPRVRHTVLVSGESWPMMASRSVLPHQVCASSSLANR